MDLISDTIERYTSLFGVPPELVVTAPGRVNLIGEHTDYTGGYVLPMAIDRSIILAGGKRGDGLLAMHSVDLQASSTGALLTLSSDRKNHWSNYLNGVAWILRQAGHKLGGMNVCIRGTIPIAAGLSSSAALEVAGAVLFSSLNKLHRSPGEMIDIARRAETEFAGVRCGIMDQFISMMGTREHALFLDCETLRFEQVHCPPEMRVVICDTGIKRELAASAYNFRRAECEEALRIIRAHLGPGVGFRQLSLPQLEEIRHLFPSTIARRARHVISENERVWHAVEALRANDLYKLGRLMADSHRSLRDDFEVSSRELDAIVDIAHSLPGAYGARMTGAGFGGSAICLVMPNLVDDFARALRSQYLARVGKSPSVYLTAPADGATIVVPGNPYSQVSFVRDLK